MSEEVKILEQLLRQQTGFKLKVRREIEGLKALSNLKKDVFMEHRENIKRWLCRLDELDAEMASICLEDSGSWEERRAETKLDFEFRSSIYQDLSLMVEQFEDVSEIRNSAAASNSNSHVSTAPPKPLMKAPTFSGRATEDKFAFKNFLAHFENYVACVGSKAARFQYLRSCLTDYALLIIQHLSICDQNYEVALSLLNEEFLDEAFIIDETLKQILEYKPSRDSKFEGVKVFLNRIKANLWELRNNFSLDFFEEDTAGYVLMSHIVFSKLPGELQKELIQRYNSNYPALNHILRSYNDIIKTLVKLRVEPVRSGPYRTGIYMPSKPGLKKTSPALENFSTWARKGPAKHCAFCVADGHWKDDCLRYVSHQDRVRRCSALNLCPLCASEKHSAVDCPGNREGFSWPCRYCSSHGHHSALCPDVVTKESLVNTCINTGVTNQPYILPIYSVLLKRGKRWCKCNCLLDSGSQRSYFSSDILESLQCNPLAGTGVEYAISTYLGTQQKRLREVVLEVELVPGVRRPLPVLIDRLFDMKLEFSSYGQVIHNLKELGYSLAAEVESDSRVVNLQGLLGVDLIQFIKPLNQIKCLHGSAWETTKGIIPFGNSIHFLYPHQIVPVESSASNATDYKMVISKMASCPTSLVNFVLAPKHSYDDPCGDSFRESSVERGIEQLFSIETLGLTEERDISEYDQEKIGKFEESIDFKNKCYYVKLPWLEDKLHLVPSNYSVALGVLDRVVKRLERSNQYQDYLEVFREQEREGVIEKIEVNPSEYKNYIWLPHRPVFKEGEQSTTKIRPVFNCSLKTKGAISLNEAVYPGINLMGDLLKLLLLFRSNKYVLLGDIRKAFLRIKLSSEEDKNRFCFFLKKGNKLLSYRYCSLIFGFNASPFILNYVLKHHASRYPEDECTHMLNNHFYVDNLVKTCNSTQELKSLYSGSVERMSEGNFQLRSCNTNCSELRERMREDGTLVKHSSLCEKVLGYEYNPYQDLLCVSHHSNDPEASTKRSILSEVSRNFDPLSMCLPVTIRGRILISELWKLNLDWDDPIPHDLLLTWNILSKELSSLSTLQFPRRALNEGEDSSLILFCDASKRAYGFTAYSVREGISSLIFAKAKVAPLKEKTLPTLELLSVFLGFKCLATLLCTFSRVHFGEIIIAIDAQIVLSWLLSDTIKTKNIFAKNRVKDIGEIKREIEARFSVRILFKYVPTDANPADMITRGISISKFKTNFDFWLRGPKWLSIQPIEWPVSDLNCLSPENKNVIQSAVFFGSLTERVEPVVSFERYSSLDKLLKVTSCVITFINKLRHLVLDCKQCAWLHLIKTMQQQAFEEEREYLSKPNKDNIPGLVKNLNLFCDDQGIVRSRGRIDKCDVYDYEVTHPILLAKKHPLTRLIILDCHAKCNHLSIASTLSKVRLSGFWIPQARQAIKTVISECILCKRFNSVSLAYPKMDCLPKTRVNLTKSFLHTGVDFTGHIWVNTTGGRSKMYLLIFTCLNIRALHVELIEDMTVRSFVLAFIRFTNLYGIPSHIYSDNAKTFLAAGKLLKEVFVSNEYTNSFGSYHIKHLTIPLYSAWFGSVWERLIRTVKLCLYKSLGRSSVDYFYLLTILSDIQNAINNRPLTYRCSSDSGLDFISPNNILRPGKNVGIMIRKLNDDICSAEPPNQASIIETVRRRNQMLKKFERLWYEEYLLSLRESSRDLFRTPFENKIKTGDIVLIKGPNKPRPLWMMGRILSLIHGEDGLVRSVTLKKGDGSIQTHSVKHLFPLELAVTHKENGVAICPGCGEREDDRPLICCDGCDEWYHWVCADISTAPPEEEQWFCLNCVNK